MKARFVSLILATALLPAFGQAPQTRTKVRVPDATAALSIAEPALIKVFGKEKIDYERPLNAALKDGVWYVSGTLCCPDSKGQRVFNTPKKPVCVGGVAMAAIRQKDGKILQIGHGK